MSDSHAHGHHDLPDYVGHHFESADQQDQSGKLGIWLFLSTEILLFSGLFCAYAVWRALQPEIFQYGHLKLDPVLGGINTVVLLTSSLTMAWAVRAAARSDQKTLILMLSLTLLGAFGFMGIKAIEYTDKFNKGVFPGLSYYGDHDTTREKELAADEERAARTAAQDEAAAAGEVQPGDSIVGQTGSSGVRTDLRSAGEAPRGTAAMPEIEEESHGEGDSKGSGSSDYGGGDGHGGGEAPDNVHLFFSIYFVMTGLHAVHVLAGMIVIGWLIWGSVKGVYHSGFYTAVDAGGRYWRLVDLVWIYLFPMLYLID